MKNRPTPLVAQIVDPAPLPTTPATLLALAVQQGAGMDTLERLMALAERHDANEARKAYVAAMADFKAEPMRIGKNKHVSFKTSSGTTEYDHAELADVTDVVVPRLAKHGFSHGWTVSQEGGGITVACKITHRLGHFEVVEMKAPPDSSGGKNGIQAIASTKTYLERYTLLAATGLATGGQDDDGRSAYEEPAPELTPEQVEEVKNARKRTYFAEAYERNEDAMLQIKERLAFDDVEGAARAWFDLSQADQLALFIAPTKAGEYRAKAFTTAQRETIRTEFSKYATQEPQA
jgi:hypothetical protein